MSQRIILFLAVLLEAIADVVLNGSATCSGFAEEVGLCPDLMPCAGCTPINCQFGSWGTWYEELTCTGVCFRKRTITKHHNECGTPCSGKSIESKACLKSDCDTAVHDCAFSSWTGWSPCATKTDQRVRTRQILTLASPQGAPCQGDMKETQDCGGALGPVNCSYAAWAPWTKCSVTCGIGHRQRMRVIQTRAAGSGSLCVGNLSQVDICSTQACAGIEDCAMGPWADWAGCDATNPAQRYRLRAVQSPARGGGKGCDATVKETKGCPLSVQAPVDCVFSDWEEWRNCSRTCGGGQSFRHRALQVPPNSGGLCNTSTTDETRGCNNQPCAPEGPNSTGTPCQFNLWGQWSTCSHECGSGTRKRVRSVAAEATGSGDTCNGGVTEIVSCEGTETACLPVDCVWGPWEDWSGCTKSCGGGYIRRNRFVAIAPVRGGRLCQPLETAQVEACNSEPCNPCVDGFWADWGPWSGCSATCSNGTRARHRELGQPPSSCGKPPIGKKDDFEVCMNAPCVADADCRLSPWGSWSSCCPDCFGVRKRTRQIEQYATGWGKPCSDTVWQTEACNPGPDGIIPELCRFMSPPSNCHLSPWSLWSTCTASCGGGQSGRQRSITTWPDDGGRACDQVSLGETRECGTQPCMATGCIDCLWGPWSDWGHCFKCGDQRERKRMIEKLPNSCGRRCDARSAAETSNCYSECNEKRMFCAWTEWTPYSSCPAQGCGPHVARRHRVLQWHKRSRDFENSTNSSKFLFKGPKDAFCVGSVSENQECPYRSCTAPCVPEPCIFGHWTDWGEPMCEGLCERTRLVDHNAVCGARPCEGPLVETKPCVSNCSMKVDCELGPWTAWSQCHSKYGQKYRTREISKPTMHGGRTCRGPLRETVPCWWSGARNECVIGQWGTWSSCTETCGDATMTRKRHILMPATDGGEGCTDTLEEIRSCGLPTCHPFVPSAAVNCILNTWTDWICGSDDIESRERSVRVPLSNGGKACEGPTKEVRPCPPVDCKVSDWAAWATCDKSCSGGNRMRSRQIDTHAKLGGKPCPESLSMQEIAACNEAPCNPSVDCAVGLWGDWAACSSSCGPGQQTRERSISHPRQANGIGCNLPLTQIQPCMLVECTGIDCVWQDWSVWSICTLTCGGGEQRRNRDIAVQPQRGGKPCSPIPKEELRPCSMQTCQVSNCIDAAWAQWSNWGACSASCNGGVAWRARVVQTAANYCGGPAVGADREYRSCSTEVSCGRIDCQFSLWSEWSNCTQVCNGLKRRSRKIDQPASGGGSSCTGPLNQTGPCNPSVGEKTPMGCTTGQGPERTTCSFSDWSVGGCSLTCGGGHLLKSRQTQLAPAVHGASSSCDGATSLVVPCNKQACPDDIVTPCKWGDWGDWGECNKCGGERKRHRQIQQMPANGAVCSAEASEDLGSCPRNCDGFAPGSYCTWQDWAQWGSCDATCGRGQRKRRRTLAMIEGGALPDSIAMIMGMARRYEEGHTWLTPTKAEELERARMQELTAAFAAGVAFFSVVLLSVQRIIRRQASHVISRSSPLE